MNGSDDCTWIRYCIQWIDCCDIICMLYWDLSEGIDNSFHNPFMHQTCLTNFDQGGWKGRMLSIRDTEKALKAGLLHHLLLLMKIVHFSVFSYGYFMRNCHWLIWWHVILIALYFEIKWEWQLRQILLFWWIRHCFYLQTFSPCHWYFLIDELWNQVNWVIMLLLHLSSLRWMLIHGVVFMATALCSLMNSEIY